MEYKQLKINTKGRLWLSVKKCARLILEGAVLVIDPSIGSHSSMPGFAILRVGCLTNRGTIAVEPTGSTHDRLFAIGECLRRDFPTAWDVLVVEDIPDRRFSKSGRGSIRQQVQLHRAVGAVHASVRCVHAISVHPATWHAVVPPDYVKSDAGDAAAMAEVVRQYATAVIARAQKKSRERKSRTKR